MNFRPLLLALGLMASVSAFAAPGVELQTSQGVIVLELDAARAPKTVANFLQYARDGFYDGTIFHRVIPGFMIQGGGFTPDMAPKKTGAPIANEAGNGLKNDAYTIAMARTNDPHSATAQFFINVVNNDFLNFKSPGGNGWGYAVFGKLTQGIEVVDKIAKAATGNRGPHQNVPTEPIVILSVKVLSDK
ncbi:peptidyl-prolyl cis-trans isomerase [Betaproteobacteria bacterium]|nr:peptidyl-prolyl cis-trans isomerase [Betaproteobacteria bacterium]